MDAYQTPGSNHQMILAEIIEGLREYQQILVDSAGKIADGDTAMNLYEVANQHAELEVQLRKLAKSDISEQTPLATPFLNQIRALGQRLRKFGDPAHSRYVMCEIIQTEERMIRRFRALIDQVEDVAWRRRLTTYLFRMLEVRESMSRLRNRQTQSFKLGRVQTFGTSTTSDAIRRN